MKTIYLAQPLPAPPPPTAATVGFFDGVHLGHRFLIREVKEAAEKDGLASTVVTFDRHPRQVLHQDYQPELLTTLPMRQALLERTGIDQTAVLNFSEETARLSARDFMDRILRRRLNVKKLVIGYDNGFGHDRRETFDDYVRYGRELGIDVIRHTAYTLEGIQISSSVIRTLLKAGEVALARRCLGYPYTLTGKVVGGYQEGRQLGFPTANLSLGDASLLVPAHGVYAVRVRLEQGGEELPAMMNIGTRPTFDGTHRSLEVNIFGFSQDIYGRTLSVSFYQRLREEKKFANVTLLVAQLKDDERRAQEYFNSPAGS